MFVVNAVNYMLRHNPDTNQILYLTGSVFPLFKIHKCICLIEHEMPNCISRVLAKFNQMIYSLVHLSVLHCLLAESVLSSKCAGFREEKFW